MLGGWLRHVVHQPIEADGFKGAAPCRAASLIGSPKGSIPWPGAPPSVIVDLNMVGNQAILRCSAIRRDRRVAGGGRTLMGTASLATGGAAR
jgi:hypothetical protein